MWGEINVSRGIKEFGSGWGKRLALYTTPNGSLASSKPNMTHMNHFYQAKEKKNPEGIFSEIEFLNQNTVDPGSIIICSEYRALYWFQFHLE